MDSSTIRDIAEESATEVPAETPVISEPKAPETPQEENFAEPVDPKALAKMSPEELLEVRKNWERAYTAKRQKETAEIKAYQQRIAELETHAPQTEQVQVKADEAQRQVELGQMSVPEYTEYVKGLMADEARKIAREEYQTLHTEEREQQLAQKALTDFTSTDARLSETSPDYDELFATEVKRELAELLDKHMAEHSSYTGFDAKALTKQIVERKDEALDSIIKTRTQQSTQAAKMREAKMRKTEVRGSSSDGQRTEGDSIRSILLETLDGAA